MKESERITKLFEDLYNGRPWLEVTLVGKLKGISAEKAAKKLFGDWNSIWEIVNHLISWRLEVLKRVNGESTVSPKNNYFSPITDTSEAAWKHTLAKLEQSQTQWVDFLKAFGDDDFSRMYPENNMSYYEHIHGVIQHDAYHLGQIALLAKTTGTSADRGEEREEF